MTVLPESTVECGGGGGSAPGPDIDPFVRLQPPTPGTPDTGNYNISGVGIIGSQLGVGGADLSSDQPVVSVLADFNTFSTGIKVHTSNSSGVGIFVETEFGTGAAGVTIISDDTGLFAQSKINPSVWAQSVDPGNAQPTVRIRQVPTGLAHLLTVELSNGTPFVTAAPLNGGVLILGDAASAGNKIAIRNVKTSDRVGGQWRSVAHGPDYRRGGF